MSYKYVYDESSFINILYFDKNNINKLVFKTYDKYFHLIYRRKLY